MFLAQPEDNNAVYKCEANNIMLQQPLSAEITLSVQCKILVMLGLLAFNQLSIKFDNFGKLKPDTFNGKLGGNLSITMSDLFWSDQSKQFSLL